MPRDGAVVLFATPPFAEKKLREIGANFVLLSVVSSYTTG